MRRHLVSAAGAIDSTAIVKLALEAAGWKNSRLSCHRYVMCDALPHPPAAMPIGHYFASAPTVLRRVDNSSRLCIQHPAGAARERPIEREWPANSTTYIDRQCRGPRDLEPNLHGQPRLRLLPTPGHAAHALVVVRVESVCTMWGLWMRTKQCSGSRARSSTAPNGRRLGRAFRFPSAHDDTREGSPRRAAGGSLSRPSKDESPR
jgi:hypothetical protein